MPLLLIIFVLMTACTTIPTQTKSKKSEVKVMSFNIRLDHKPDSLIGSGWVPHRREKVVDLIRHYDPDLLGVQEAIRHQLDYILEQLPEYQFIGVGRDDGKTSGEYSAILYKKDRFDVLKHNTFWLSTTPDTPSKAWDAALPRIVTWGKFKDKMSGEEFFYFNTHFDHIGVKAREESAKLILKKIEELADNEQVILSGDFNVTPDTEPYAVLSKGLKDAAKVSEKPPYGPEGTFSGFDLSPDKDFRRIDYIFVENVTVESYETIADYSGSKYPSDHLPVMAVINFN